MNAEMIEEWRQALTQNAAVDQSEIDAAVQAAVGMVEEGIENLQLPKGVHIGEPFGSDGPLLHVDNFVSLEEDDPVSYMPRGSDDIKPVFTPTPTATAPISVQETLNTVEGRSVPAEGHCESESLAVSFERPIDSPGPGNTSSTMKLAVRTEAAAGVTGVTGVTGVNHESGDEDCGGSVGEPAVESQDCPLEPPGSDIPLLGPGPHFLTPGTSGSEGLPSSSSRTHRGLSTLEGPSFDVMAQGPDDEKFDFASDIQDLGAE
jgi:hypothetical protein